MFSSTTAASSLRLNSNSYPNYQSIPQDAERSTQEGVHVDIPSDDSSSHSVNEQAPMPTERTLSAEELPAVTAERSQDNVSEYCSKASLAFNLSTLATLVTMKWNGHIDEHPNYFWILAADLGLSFASLCAADSHFSPYVDHVRGKVKMVKTFCPSLNLARINPTLATSIESVRQKALTPKRLNFLSTLIAEAMLITMAFKGHFDKHPVYFGIALLCLRLSQIAAVISEETRQKSPGEM